MNKFLDNLMLSGVLQIGFIVAGAVIIFGAASSCEAEKRKARIECIKLKTVDECNRLIVN